MNLSNDQCHAEEPAGSPAAPADPKAAPAVASKRQIRRSNRSRARWGTAIVVGWVLVAVGAVLAAVSLWVRRTFGEITIDQLMMNVQGGGGQGAGGAGIVTDVVFSALVWPLTAVLALAIGIEYARRSVARRRVARAAVPRTQRWVRGLAVVLALAIPVAGAASLGATIGAHDYVDSYVREAVTGTTLGDFYVVPGDKPQAAVASNLGSSEGEPRNLVVIYLESVEDAFADDTLFEKNMVEPVQRATAGWETIPRLEQYAGGGWTMAGIVGTQCGVPLRSASATVDINELNLMGNDGEAVESYLPGAVCLGDVLKEQGYRNVFLGGADANFAGKGTFLRDHGYDEVHDFSTWQEAGETEVNPDWGLSDRRLFEIAVETVAELHDAGQPFNLTMLTLDTHEHPYAHDYCEIDTDVPLTAITLCSMDQVAGFIDVLDEQGYLDDTAVMVMGDHEKFIAESNNFYSELGSLDTHSIFNRMWLPAGSGLEIERDTTDQLSMFATLLEMAGTPVADHRAGVGVSVFASETPPGSLLELDPDAYRDVVTSRSTEFYRGLWAGDTIEEAARTDAAPAH